MPEAQKELVATIDVGRRRITVSICRREDGEHWAELAAGFSGRDGRPRLDVTRLRPRQVTALIEALRTACDRLGGQP